jgi:translation initiation factor IF-1
MVGYIFLSNRARWWEKKLNIIITTKFKEYYIYEISNLNRRCVEKLRKLIKKDNIKQVACEEEIQQYVDKKILIDEKDIIKYLILEILEYIFEIQGKKMEQEDIYFLINKDEDIYLENIKTLSEKFKTTNIITEELSKFQKIVENIFEEETTIYLSNNKRKSLRRAKYIVNFDYGIGEIEKYNINRTAILINIEQKVKIESMAFEGISINNVNIQISDELIEHFGRMMEKINKNILYMSLVNQKQELARIKDRIKEDNIHILNLIGDKGIISQEEFKRIP